MADNRDSMSYFIRQWLASLPSAKMQYVEGWKPNPDDPYTPYDYYKAYLNRHPRSVGIDWTDKKTGWGPRWHYMDKSPQGQWLKTPWHPSHWAEEYEELMNQWQKAKKESSK